MAGSVAFMEATLERNALTQNDGSVELSLVEQLQHIERDLRGRAKQLFSESRAQQREGNLARADQLQEAGAVTTIAFRAIEDARSRYTQGRALELDAYSPADLDRLTPDAERAAFLAKAAHADDVAAGPGEIARPVQPQDTPGAYAESLPRPSDE